MAVTTSGTRRPPSETANTSGDRETFETSGIRPVHARNRASNDEGGTQDGRSGRADAPRPPQFYQTRDVVEILGISRRQLQYWSQTDLVRPSGATPGGHRRYNFEDLVALKAAKRLIDAGVSVQRIRSSIGSLRETLPEVERPLSELVLVATGDIVLVFREGAAFEAVSGQEWVFPVADFQREVETWRREVGARPRKRRDATARSARIEGINAR
jgi:DNA-binding transcriptional MerR regulator